MCPGMVSLDGKEGMVTDSMIRLSMSTVRDLLRSGHLCEGATERKASIDNPEVVFIWGLSRRALYMPEVETFEVYSKGIYDFSFKIVVQHSNCRSY